jgi:glycosyltransferase involved in cell wall biosynthesis
MPGSDTASVFIRDWVQSLEAEGWKVTILAPEPAVARPVPSDPTVPFTFAYCPIQTLQTLAYGAGMFENVLENPARLALLPAFLLSFLGHAAHLCRAADVVHAHWLFPSGLVGALVKLWNPKPLVVTVHSTDYHLLHSWPGGRHVARFVAHNADRLHFVANCYRTAFLRWIEASDEVLAKTYVVPMGISSAMKLPATRPLSERPKVGFLGRLIPFKGVDSLIRACAEVGQYELEIAGNGPEQDRLARLAIRVGVRARFGGIVSGAAKREFIDNCDILVYPSRQDRSGRAEGVPVAIVEALARGRVVIASDSGGIPEIVEHGRNGYLYPANDERALTRLLRRIVHAWPGAAGIVTSARETGLRLSASHLVRAHCSTYRDIHRLAGATDLRKIPC